MKIITCTGHYGTGSSAITDLMKEYSNVSCKTDFEVALIYEYNGINSLHYHLVDNPTRQGNRVIYDFLNNCRNLAFYGTEMNYQKYFKGVFWASTCEYVEKIGGQSLDVINWKGFQEKSPLYKSFFRVINKLYSITHKESYKFITGQPPIPYYLHTVDKNYFMTCTKEYLKNLLEAINDKEFLMIDQLVSSSKIDNCTRYFDDIKVIVVDRDPRDIYLSMKYIWRDNLGKELSGNIRLFCEWYEWLRRLDTKQKDKYLYIQFEDMLWDYDNTIEKIEKYCGLDNTKHIEKGKYFAPEISKRNCELWDQYECEKENIEYIEQYLKEYLYVK